MIAAGRDTLTVNNTDRIRIEPLPQSFSPDWDLSTAYLTPDVTGGGLVMIPVTIYAQGTEVPVYTAAPTAEPVQETPAPEGSTWPRRTSTAAAIPNGYRT